MLEESMPGSMLEAPVSFQAVSAPVWPRLHVALGYSGGARWVAFYVSGHQTRYHDGASSAEVADQGLFFAYQRHPKIAPHLAGVHLGMADEEARTWLVLDTLQHLCYLAEPEEARRFLARQWPHDAGIPLELTPEELGRLLAALDEAPLEPSNRHERWAETLREHQANYKWLMLWLEHQPGGSSV